MDSQSKITDLRDASFSYLTTAKQEFVLKLTESLQLPEPAITSSQDTDFSISLKRANAKDSEISVFAAEKYFNMKLDDESPRFLDTSAGKNVHEKENRVDHHRVRPKSRPGTPSVKSEASWNSQTALLPSSLRNSSQSRHKRLNERWFFAGFGCNGSCSDEKSVYIDKDVAHRGLHGKEFRKEAIQVGRNPFISGARKQSQSRLQVMKDDFGSPSFEKTSIGSNREEYHVLPTVNSGVQNLKVEREEQKSQGEEPRMSLEVFGSHTIKKEAIATNLERKLSVLTWDAIPKSQSPAVTSARSQMCEDIESDASSDLFEIENLTGSAQPTFTKEPPSCMTPTSLYEPTETSIEWSAVTASAADFSAVSDYDEKKLPENSTNPGLTSVARKGRSNGLLGCKSHKSVEVAETAYKRTESAKSQ